MDKDKTPAGSTTNRGEPRRHGCGVTISGNAVGTAGGDIVGRDGIQHLSAPQIKNIFEPLRRGIEAADSPEGVTREAILRALNEEIGKGPHAADSVIVRVVEGLAELLPAGISSVVGSFAALR